MLAFRSFCLSKQLFSSSVTRQKRQNKKHFKHSVPTPIGLTNFSIDQSRCLTSGTVQTLPDPSTQKLLNIQATAPTLSNSLHGSTNLFRQKSLLIAVTNTLTFIKD